MALQTYSILYLNLVCEMIYVVTERLKTQKIQIDKSKLVLNDIIAASLSCPFLFVPTSIINKDILDKSIRCAVHSSIMRLNDSSMEKLMGLIETSVKMQMFSSNGPRQVLLVTLNHLDSIRELACTHQLKQSIDVIQHNFYQTFEKMTDGEIMRMRYAMLNYLQDIHVKVTIFIKEGLQRYNGSFVSVEKWMIPYVYRHNFYLLRTFKTRKLYNLLSNDLQLAQLRINLTQKSLNPEVRCEAPGVIRVFNKNSTLIDISTFHPISFYKVETKIGSIKPNSPRFTTLGLSIFNINKSINQSLEETSDPLFNGQTSRDGYKQEMDLFVTQLMGNDNDNEEIVNLDLEILETPLNINESKIEEKNPEHNIIDFSQITGNLSLQNIKAEMDDSVSRQTGDLLNMMQLLDLE
ncbi:protein OSCP1-like [Aphis craccivora]|uniref:Protein OSCP1-like n=1 Tax=Aphis craccivora TaxID=307492 RepID=A0A6G0Z3K7_APHCR|nr:protein OSCP1-like [Aphis craccivora]